MLGSADRGRVRRGEAIGAIRKGNTVVRWRYPNPDKAALIKEGSGKEMSDCMWCAGLAAGLTSGGGSSVAIRQVSSTVRGGAIELADYVESGQILS